MDSLSFIVIVVVALVAGEHDDEDEVPQISN
jgi:hypothetical protein